MGVLECVAIPEAELTEIQQSFIGPPEHVWTYVTNVPTTDNCNDCQHFKGNESAGSGLNHGHPHRISVKGQLRALYAHMVTMTQTAHGHESAIGNLVILPRDNRNSA